MYSTVTCGDAYVNSSSRSRKRPNSSDVAKTLMRNRLLQALQDFPCLLGQRELLRRRQIPALVVPRADEVVDRDEDRKNDEDAGNRQRSRSALRAPASPGPSLAIG